MILSGLFCSVYKKVTNPLSPLVVNITKGGTAERFGPKKPNQFLYILVVFNFKAISIGLYSEEVYKKWDFRKGIFGTFRCHLSLFVNTQGCFNFMT